eukprot:8445248-Pyramimonas_sp.AAC.2
MRPIDLRPMIWPLGPLVDPLGKPRLRGGGWLSRSGREVEEDEARARREKRENVIGEAGSRG